MNYLLPLLVINSMMTSMIITLVILSLFTLFLVFLLGKIIIATIGILSSFLLELISRVTKNGVVKVQFKSKN